MKLFAKFFAVGLLTVALVGFGACDSDDGGDPTKDVIQDTGAQDPGTQDPGTQDPGIVDPGVGDPGTEDPGVEDPGVEDPGMTDEGPCVPQCGDMECGVDPVCGESCGTCDEGFVCDTIQGKCFEECDWATEKPAEWGPAGVISYLQTPANKTAAAGVCYDYTGEGTGDSGLAGLAGQVNPALIDAIDGGDIGIIFEFTDVTDFADSGMFALNGLLGASTADPAMVGGEYDLSEDGYVTDTCRPLIYFMGAEIVGGELTTPKSRFALSIPLDETLIIDVNLIDAMLTGTVTEGGADGVVLTDGVLSGILTRSEIEATIDALQVACDAAPEGEAPSYCGYLGTARTLLPTLYDLHRSDDGEYFVKGGEYTANAISVCMTYELAKATIRGFEAAE